jgi:hypothetical protein
VASLTDSIVLLDRRFSPGRFVRIVAGGAGQRSGALLKACGLAQAIGGADYLKLVVMAGPRRVVEEEHVVFDRLSGPEREHAAAETQQRRRELRTRGLEMTLQTNFHPPLWRKPRRVHDRAPDLIRRLPLAGRGDVACARSVATLTVDPFRQSAQEA